MGENQDEGKAVGNFRAGAATFLSAMFLAAIPLVFDKDKKELLEQLRVVSPLFAGGVAYTLSIPFVILAHWADIRRYKTQMRLLKEELDSLDRALDVERVEQIGKEMTAYRKKIFDINSKSLFT